MATSKAARQVYLDEQLQKAIAQLEKALQKVEHCKGLIDALEESIKSLQP